MRDAYETIQIVRGNFMADFRPPPPCDIWRHLHTQKVSHYLNGPYTLDYTYTLGYNSV